ncbi:hypothetical protein KI387_035700, partial [Taxus chinensis]
INEWLVRVGICPQFKNGLRVTDVPTMEVVEMVLVGKAIVDNGSILVIAFVVTDDNEQVYNINANTMTGEIVASLGAEKLILLTDVAGLLLDNDNPESLMKEVDIKGVKKLVEQQTISGGMILKVNCCV